MATGSPALKCRRISGGDGASGRSDYVPPLGPLLSGHATADSEQIQDAIGTTYPEHTSLAGFLQAQEDVVLSAMEAYFVDVLGYGGGLTVLIFDGIMVPKRADRPITDWDLAKASGYIGEKTGWRMKLAEKPLPPLA